MKKNKLFKIMQVLKEINICSSVCQPLYGMFSHSVTKAKPDISLSDVIVEFLNFTVRLSFFSCNKFFTAFIQSIQVCTLCLLSLPTHFLLCTFMASVKSFIDVWFAERRLVYLAVGICLIQQLSLYRHFDVSRKCILSAVFVLLTQASCEASQTSVQNRKPHSHRLLIKSENRRCLK